ncbi:chemotaxis protein CheB [Streptosporangium sp. NPDC023615]|uniref:chemotaxis protein CheB n=1 Tax=Streptosporangium sp. NPDC023615 TaxID=3154794 RepID=UPI003419C305
MAVSHGRDLVVVAASAGGVEALRALMAELPADLAAAVLVVLHLPARGESALAGILDRAGPLPVTPARDGERLRHGHVHVAPPDRHLLVKEGAVRLVRGPRYNGHRPAADPLFLSAALEGGSRTLAVVLSGTLDDGARGSSVVERHGGAVAVQDPLESTFDGMPRAALAAAGSAESLPVKEIAAWLVRQSLTPVAEGPARDAAVERDVARYLLTGGSEAHEGDLTALSCPECGGPVYETAAGPETYYGCRVGHAWSPQGLAAGQAEAVERALWTAILRLEERLRLLGRMVERAESKGRNHSSRRLRRDAEETGKALETMRMLQNRIDGTGDDLVSRSGP